MSIKVCYSPAKVNLRLEVLRKRCDGYHDIMSLIQPVDLYDKVTIRIEEGDTIEVDTTQFPELNGKVNIAYKAAEIFLYETGLKFSVNITIDKFIPVAAGLGGGSSNAATVLKVLNTFFKGPLSQKRLLEIGKEIGADVPFFIYGKPAIVQGIGEMIEGVRLPEMWYLVVGFDFPVSTESIYKKLNLDLTTKRDGINIRHLKQSLGDPLAINKILLNDLEETICSKYPELEHVKKSLIEMGALGSLITGSGPTVFGLFLDRYDAKKTYDLLIDNFTQKGLSLFLVHGLN